MSEKKLDKLLKAVSDVRSAVSTSMKVSKEVISQSSKLANRVLNKDTLTSGLEVTSKGVETAAQAAKMAAKGADKLSQSLEKASHQLKKFGSKMNRKS
ncbi:MAG: hypothetical protein HYR96_01470 [Deltaproteobacteria bacterium]|nr:hypothetical protein [Deltaproteobacteria bacterium]MBI3293313.1 hypothetical protein [Deltaproteobacteria bacterium]